MAANVSQCIIEISHASGYSSSQRFLTHEPHQAVFVERATRQAGHIVLP
jgi:hypothetical protein